MPHIIRKPLEPHKRSFMYVGENTKVQQHMQAETDINNIMAKYQKTGLFTHVSKYAGQYGDFSGVPTYQEGLDRIREAEDMFMSLPAKVRDRFHNDPGTFIAFATDSSNLEEMRKMGLAPPAPPTPIAEGTERINARSDEGDPEPKAPKKKPPSGETS